VYRLTVHDGPHLDAILPLAAPPQPGAAGSFTLIGRSLGRGAAPDPRLRGEGRLLERLSIAGPPPGEAALVLASSDPARPFVPAAAATRAGFESSYVRISPAGAAPVVSNRLFIARAAAPVVLEQEPNDDDAHAQAVTPPCDLSGTFDRPGDVDRFRFPGRKGEVWWGEAIAERIGSPTGPASVIQNLGTRGKPAQDRASGDDLPDAGFAARFNTQTVDAALRWQVPEDGPYQILLNDLYGSQRGQPRLTYRLVIRREQPDFALIVLPEHPKDLHAVTVRAGGRTAATAA